MHYRRFGSTDLTTSEVGFGCARIGGVFQRSSRAEVVRLLQRAHDAGITFFDTADMYTQGESERLVGQAFRRRRDQVVIATKFGYRLSNRKQLIGRIKPFVRPLVARIGLRSQQVHARLRGTVSQQDFSPRYVINALEGSLRRLKTDYIDLYQLHDPPLEVLCREDVVEVLQLLQSQGKIRYWGVACQQPEDVLASLEQSTLASVQLGISVLEQSALEEAVPRAASRGTAVIARQVFASGLLTRALDQLAPHDIDAEPEVAVRKRALLAQFGSIAAGSGRSRAELAVHFALAVEGVSVVLLGISRSEHLQAALQALATPPLSADELRLLVAAQRP
jgi:aryl-alcohol dehydrogenase-like predicted oxidoreductase